MAHLDLSHPAGRPVPLKGYLAARSAHIQQMLAASVIASVTIIVVAALFMVAA